MKTKQEVTLAEPTQALLRGVEAALKRPVMLDPRSVDAVLAGSVFQMQSSDANAEPVHFTRSGKVAVVDIRGPLAQRAWDCMGMFGGDGYDAIVERMQAALADPQTVGVLMNIDSPGGEVAGCFEAVREIRSMARASGKKVVAYADELAASAAYALATAANEIVLPDTGVVGSVGVITTLLDQSEALERDGYKVNVIASGARKSDGHPDLPLSDDARAVIQGEIDRLAEVFAREVGAARGMSEESVLALDAGVFLGQSAVDNGLADVVGNRKKALAIAAGAPWKKKNAVSAQSIDGEKNMKSLMIELGLAENASETEALKAIKAQAARADRADQTVQKLLDVTGQTEAGAAIGAVEAWKLDAGKAKSLETELTAIKAKQVEADVDAMLASAKSDRRVTAAEMPSLRVKGLEDPAWLKGHLAVKSTVLPTGPATEPAPAAGKGLAGKSWAELKPIEKARLYKEDRATYEALKEAAGA